MLMISPAPRFVARWYRRRILLVKRNVDHRDVSASEEPPRLCALIAFDRRAGGLVKR